MKVLLWIVFGFLWSVQGKSQPVNQTMTDPKDSSEFLYGYFTRDILEKAPYSGWFRDGFDNYKADKKTLKTLKRKLPQTLQIFIVMGSWCQDSQREVPRFLKILDDIGFDPKNLTCIAVDHQKKISDFNIDYLKIERIPTILFYNGNKEGRILESPKLTLEKDMLEIVKNIR